MNVEESGSNMRFMIASGAIGALVAGLGFYFMKRYSKSNNIFYLTFLLNYTGRNV